MNTKSAHPSLSSLDATISYQSVWICPVRAVFYHNAVSHIVYLNFLAKTTTDGWPLAVIITIYKSLVDIAVRVLLVCKQQPESASTFSLPLWVGMVQLGGHLRYDCPLRASAGLRKCTAVVVGVYVAKYAVIGLGYFLQSNTLCNVDLHLCSGLRISRSYTEIRATKLTELVFLK